MLVEVRTMAVTSEDASTKFYIAIPKQLDPSWLLRVSDQLLTSMIPAMPIPHCKACNGSPAIADGSFEPTDRLLNRLLEDSDTTDRLYPVPDDTMRSQQSEDPPEKVEGAALICES